MPSLAVRQRRRAGHEASATSDVMLEGGGNRGTAHVDTEQDTQAKMKQYQQGSNAHDEIRQRAHLISFPLFLFGLLALFSHSLHLSFLSCILIPVILGGLLFGGSLLLEQVKGKGDSSALFAQHGPNFIFLLFVFTLVGLAVSQWIFRDKLGPSLL